MLSSRSGQSQQSQHASTSWHSLWTGRDSLRASVNKPLCSGAGEEWPDRLRLIVLIALRQLQCACAIAQFLVVVVETWLGWRVEDAWYVPSTSAACVDGRDPASIQTSNTACYLKEIRLSRFTWSVNTTRPSWHLAQLGWDSCWNPSYFFTVVCRSER